MKILLDPGHGGRDSGAVGGMFYEKDVNLNVALYVSRQLKTKNIDVMLTRAIDKDMGITERAKFANANNAFLFVSIHCNAAGNKLARGIETLYYPTSIKGKEYAQVFQNALIGTGIYKHLSRELQDKYDRGIKPRADLGVLRLTKMPAVLIELPFISNDEDRNLLMNEQRKFGDAIVDAIMKIHGAEETNSKTPIMGKSVATKNQMISFLTSKNSSPRINCTIAELVEIYLQEGEIEGVRGDIAFAQAIKETGYFKYGGDVVPDQNNYAGIGTTGGGVKGAYFATPRIGVQAQIQHLKAYASKEKLIQELVDPRFKLVTRGVAPNVEDLNGRWAVPGIGYGESILKILDSILAEEIEDSEVSDWAKEAWEFAVEYKIVDDERPKEFATREEVVAISVRVLQYLINVIKG